MDEILRQVLEKSGVDPRAAAILASLQAKKRGKRTEISYRDPSISEKAAEERRILEAIRKAKEEPASLLSLRSAPISPSKSVVEVRTGDTVVLWLVRETTKRRKPRTKRILAQNLPPVRVRTVEVERIVVSSPQHLMTIPLRLPGRSGRISLPASERKAVLNPPTEWQLRLQGGSAVLFVAADDIKEFREWIKRIRDKYPIGKRLEISCDGEKWTPLTELYIP